MNARVSVVIPTIGRSSLAAAVGSALDQTHPVHEVIVSVDGPHPVEVGTDDPRVRVITASEPGGAPRARRRGVDAAAGDLIALLDDDDLWHPFKTESQLDAIPRETNNWVISCRVAVRGDGARAEKVWPRTCIGPGEPVLDYLFRMNQPRLGGGFIQSSSMVFPRRLATDIPLDVDTSGVHDEPSWLDHIQRRYPDAMIVQIPGCYVSYGDGHPSTPQSTRITEYIDWGRRYLAGSSGRLRGDYFCSSPVTAAAASADPRGVLSAMRVAVREGTPGPMALLFAVAKLSTATVQFGRTLGGDRR